MTLDPRNIVMSVKFDPRSIEGIMYVESAEGAMDEAFVRRPW